MENGVKKNIRRRGATFREQGCGWWIALLLVMVAAFFLLRYASQRWEAEQRRQAQTTHPTTAAARETQGDEEGRPDPTTRPCVPPATRYTPPTTAYRYYGNPDGPVRRYSDDEPDPYYAEEFADGEDFYNEYRDYFDDLDDAANYWEAHVD